MTFKGKVVLVIGSSTGIGASIAISFAKENADVVLVGRNIAKLKAVAIICEENSGRKPLVLTADVTIEEMAKKVIDNTVAAYGKIDILINNAGILRMVSIHDTDVLKVYDEIMRTNVRAVIHLTHLAYPYIAKVKGNIINVSSIAGKRIKGCETMTMYKISKATLDHFTKCCAAQFASVGVRVNAICPGPVKTDIATNAGINEDAFWKTMQDNSPLNRVSEPDEIADLAVFLASDKAKAITGTLVVTDNGCMLNS